VNVGRFLTVVVAALLVLSIGLCRPGGARRAVATPPARLTRAAGAMREREVDDGGSWFDDVRVEAGDGHVATVEICRPPDNHFDVPLIEGLAAAFETLEEQPDCRAIVLRIRGKHFCAGARLGSGGEDLIAAARGATNPLYDAALRLFTGVIPSSRPCTAPRSAAAWASRWRPTSASPVPRRASRPTSRDSACTRASGSP